MPGQTVAAKTVQKAVAQIILYHLHYSSACNPQPTLLNVKRRKKHAPIWHP
ncbi:MAG: hypothetical protein ABFC12_05105 [Methanobacterium sp.]